MLISIVMPAYNAEKTLPQAVESVLAQTVDNWELLIADDCSEDGTAELARAYARKDQRIRVLQNERNLGASETRHRAAAAAAGEWLAFLDSDDAWLPEKLRKQLQLQQDTGARLVFTGSGFLNEQGEKLDWVLHVPQQVGYRQLLKQNVVSNSSVLVEKAAYLRFEIVGNDMHEDFACWLNMMRSGVVAYGIDEPLLQYRLSAGSKSGNKWKAARMNWNTYRRLGLNVFQALYYMVWYTVKGILKYKNLR